MARICNTCGSSPCINPGFCRSCREADRRNKRNAHPYQRLMANVISLEAAWRELNSRRPTPEATLETIKHAVRTRGIAALTEPAIRERISRCDEDAFSALDAWLTKFKKDKADAENPKPRAG
jgi:hypothetical protein